MPASLAWVTNLIPSDTFSKLKRFLSNDKIKLYDFTFKLSTKYVPTLLVVMLTVSFSNQMAKEIDIDCESRSSEKTSSNNPSGRKFDHELNDFCWNYETFLVKKALDPSMRGQVMYPGVGSYNKDKDDIIPLRYYKNVWVYISILFMIAYFPHLVWKVRGSEKIETILKFEQVGNVDLVKTKVSYFLETVGFNGNFAWSYVSCKILATLTPLIQLAGATLLIGNEYMLYGLDVLKFALGLSPPWPNPMDTIFPKVAKCQKGNIGESGDFDIRAAQCDLPLNTLSQWTFFVYWWCLIGTYILNVVSFIRLLVMLFPPLRWLEYKRFVANASKENVELARTYEEVTKDGRQVTRQKNKFSVIRVNLSFGDWIVLYLLSMNLRECDFRQFIRELSVTENSVLQIQPVGHSLLPMYLRPELATNYQTLIPIPKGIDLNLNENSNEYSDQILNRNPIPVSYKRPALVIHKPVKYERPIPGAKPVDNQENEDSNTEIDRSKYNWNDYNGSNHAVVQKFIDKFKPLPKPAYHVNAAAAAERSKQVQNIGERWD